MKPEQELQAWQHWRDACALSLISEPERSHLCLVIAQRFRSMLRRVNLHGHGQLAAPPDGDCAHLFETYCAMHQRRDGKKYKHWLLTRGRRDVDTVQSGVMLLIRNVVREWIRDAYPQTAPVSLQQAAGKGKTPIPLEELLPDSSAVDRTGEQTLWIKNEIKSALGEMDDLKRAVLRLRHQGIVFSAPGVRSRVGYGKSSLYQCHREWMQELAGSVQDRFPGVTAVEGTAMVLDLLDELGRIIHTDFSVENQPSAAFGEVEVHNDSQ